MKKKYCSVYLRNAEEGASCYYRVFQYIKKIDYKFKVNNAMTRNMYRTNLDCKNNNIKKVIQGYFYSLMLFRLMFFIIRDIIQKPSYVIIQRTIIPRYTPLPLRVLLGILARNTTLYWDFDDEIFLDGEICKKQSKILSEYAITIIVTNEYLKNTISEEYRDKVIKLPTTDGDFQGFDNEAVLAERGALFQKEIRLVWVATRVNIPNLEKIIRILDIAAERLMTEKNKQLILTVVCNQSVIKETKYLKIKNIEWTRERAKEEIYMAHIGIMPLIASKFALGKGGFKLVQYISTGLPIIASNVGFNSEVVNKSCGILVDDKYSNDAWLDAIEQIANSWEVWRHYSIGAEQQWINYFSYQDNLNKWKKMLSVIAG
jgi:glycosyltransferase involved in cell wall biosynthesis